MNSLLAYHWYCGVRGYYGKYSSIRKEEAVQQEQWSCKGALKRIRTLHSPEFWSRAITTAIAVSIARPDALSI